MTVQCPHCQTQYRVPASRLSGARPVFKCTKCKHVFETEPDRRPRRRRGDKNDDSLPLPFPTDETPLETGDEETFDREPEESAPDFEEELPDEEAEVDPEPEDEELVEEPAWVRSEAGSGKRAKSKAASARKRRAVATKPPPEPEPEPEEDEFEPELDEEEADPEPVVVAAKKKPAKIRPRAAKAKPRRSPLKPIAICVGAILCFYSLVAITLERNPVDTLSWLSEVPILGGLLGRDHLLVWRLEVTELEGGLDYIRGHQLAYVVSGRAVNTTREDLRIIEVEGSLIADGKPARRQRVYAANQARSTIRDLSANEVEMLLRLEPNRRFRIRPGESASFLLVFPRPPSAVEEVVVRVVDARAT